MSKKIIYVYLFTDNYSHFPGIFQMTYAPLYFVKKHHFFLYFTKYRWCCHLKHA